MDSSISSPSRYLTRQPLSFRVSHVVYQRLDAPHSDAATSVTALNVVARQGDINRALWQKRLDGLLAAAGADGVEAASIPLVVPLPTGLTQSQDQHYRSVFPLSLPPSLLAPLPLPTPETHTVTDTWPRATVSEDESESSTPTRHAKASKHRGNRAHSSVSSISSAAMSPSPFSTGAGGDAASTAASSPASQPKSLVGDVAATLSQITSLTSPTEPPTTPMRAAYNASVRRKKSFHRQSWDIQRTLRSPKDEQAPPVPFLPSRDNPKQ